MVLPFHASLEVGELWPEGQVLYSADIKLLIFTPSLSVPKQDSISVVEEFPVPGMAQHMDATPPLPPPSLGKSEERLCT